MAEEAEAEAVAVAVEDTSPRPALVRREVAEVHHFIPCRWEALAADG